MAERRTAVLEGTRIRRTRDPDDGQVEAAVLNLAREGSAILSEHDEVNSYIQVWQRLDGLYLLEYRAGSPLEHFQTITISADKIHTAFQAWLRDESGWTDQFTWKSISELL